MRREWFFRSLLVTGASDCVDFHLDPERKCCDLDRSPGRGRVARKVRGIHGIHPGKHREVGEIDRRLQYAIERRVSRFEYCTQVVEDLARLRFDVAFDDGASLRVERDCPGSKEQTIGANGLGVRANRVRGVRRPDFCTTTC